MTDRRAALGEGASEVRLRQGLLRAPPFGARRPILSLTLRPDRTTRRLSQVEQALAAPAAPDPRAMARAQDALAALSVARVGGAFWGARIEDATGAGPELVVLRPRSAAQLRAMMQEALANTDAASILVSAPDKLWARCARGLASTVKVDWRFGPLDPWSVLPRLRRLVATGDDPLAALALLGGLKVHCLAPGDVAGWGMTTDWPDIPRRDLRGADRLAHAQLLGGVAYRSPFTGAPIDCETAIGLLADWRRGFERTRRLSACKGIAPWKRRAVNELLHDGGPVPHPLRRLGALSPGRAAHEGDLAVWATRSPRGLAARAEAEGRRLWRIEDGFLRSIGLGAELHPPCSIVLDLRGLHYDPDQPSDLESLLQTTAFPPALLLRAGRLIDAILGRRLSKYNVGAEQRLNLPHGRRVVLATGQVADDQALRLAGAGIGTMLDFLGRVRAAEPQAHIVYKPHPDVAAGLRRGALARSEALRFADDVVDGAMPALLDQVDAVHTISSLAGFEALLRRREVTVHGQPFYAGWGLTHDLAPPQRRGRALSLAELVAGALILYPLYRDPVTGLPCPPEVLIERWSAPARAPSGLLPRLRRLQGRAVRWSTERTS